MIKSEIMTTTLDVIYENGIFKPLSSVPKNLREHEKLKITIETDFDKDLEEEILQWEQATDEDFLKFEQSLEEKI
jgi:predicted DNA-binding antitoxin AbrB/MazE fold protein